MAIIGIVFVVAIIGRSTLCDSLHVTVHQTAYRYCSN